MKLYKYKSLENLWHILDIVFNDRLYCARWDELNDPFEGYYEIWLKNHSHEMLSKIDSRVRTRRDALRIASLSSDSTNCLLWAHYACGYKGIAIEVDIPEDDPELHLVDCDFFFPVITDEEQTDYRMDHLFCSKTEDWGYEKEYRIISEESYFKLQTPVKRVLVGPNVSRERKEILKSAMGHKVKLVFMELDLEQRKIRPSTSSFDS